MEKKYLQKLWIALSVLVSIPFGAVACQPTPAEEIVIQKDLDAVLDEQVQQAAQEPEVSATPAQPYEAPERWEEELELPYLTFHIQADVITPEITQYPVLCVKSRTLTPEDVLERLAPLFDGAVSYFPDVRVRAEYELELMYARRGIWNPETEEYEPYPGQADEIAALEQLIAEAPDKMTEHSISEFSLPVLPARFHLKYADGSRVELALTSHSLWINYGGDALLQPECWLHEDNEMTGEKGIDQLQNVKISETEALEAAEEAMERYGLRNLGLISAERGRLYDSPARQTVSEGWILTWGRNDCGYLPFDLGMCSDSGGDPNIEYFAPIATEELKIYVDETGVRRLSWEDPWEIAEEPYAENATLLPFDALQERVRKQLKYEWSWVDSINPYSSLDQNMCDLTLTYCLVPKKDDLGAALLVPAWIGRYKNIADADRPNVVYKTVALNAIDGTRVSPMQRWDSP